MRLIRFFPAVFLIAVIGASCYDKVGFIENEPLITAGSTVITVNDYLKALEVAKTAYTHKMIIKDDAFKIMKPRLLSQMIEELVIIKAAEEKQITISDEELQAQADMIKKDYPDGVFGEILLESAITERLWKSRLRQRMLMEKVLAAEFDSRIAVSPDDMKNYYAENAGKIESEFENGEDEAAVYDRILKRMKLEKKQVAYQAWIDQKKNDYSIEVNQKIWEKILDL